MCSLIILHFPLGGSVCTPGRQRPDQSTTNLAELRKIATFLMKNTIFNGHPVFYEREEHTMYQRISAVGDHSEGVPALP